MLHGITRKASKSCTVIPLQVQRGSVIIDEVKPGVTIGIDPSSNKVQVTNTVTVGVANTAPIPVEIKNPANCRDYNGAAAYQG